MTGQSRSGRRWAARLDTWAALPPRQTNTGAVVFTVLMMVCLLGGTRDMPSRASFLRGVAVAFVGLHGVLHLAIIRGLARMQSGGIAAAGRALRAYRDPRRVTNLDLVIGWAGLCGSDEPAVNRP
ncbi:MAG TPA: hypothetical protein VMH36_08845 [Alphaproteobacteria bacterium]|nr:hypothetical protein [Alphaproteobacteria bacterium]